VGIACFLVAHPTPGTLSAGAVLAVIGLAIRAGAAGHLRKHKSLATAGPYAWTRNPLYLGSILLGAGFLIAATSWIAAGLAALYLAVFYPGVMRREEEELRAEYGADFDDYARRVPRFWPRPPRGSPEEPFSWIQYRANREYQALAGAAVAFAILAAEMIWRGR
jgi:protein-S-isoprenylcysteine O-methyltransferase Ste14